MHLKGTDSLLEWTMLKSGEMPLCEEKREP